MLNCSSSSDPKGGGGQVDQGQSGAGASDIIDALSFVVQDSPSENVSTHIIYNNGSVALCL